MELSATSYAILGLLAVRPWSSYELTKYMQTSAVRAVWPRAASKLYDEPKKLEAAGLASAQRERAEGRRQRTVYKITARGRRALAAWLELPPAPALLEFEGALKIIHSDGGGPGVINRQLEIIKSQAGDLKSVCAGIASAIAERGPAIPERALTNMLVLDLAMRMQTMIEDWAAWAQSISAQAAPGDARDRIARREVKRLAAACARD